MSSIIFWKKREIILFATQIKIYPASLAVTTRLICSQGNHMLTWDHVRFLDIFLGPIFLSKCSITYHTQAFFMGVLAAVMEVYRWQVEFNSDYELHNIFNLDWFTIFHRIKKVLAAPQTFSFSEKYKITPKVYNIFNKEVSFLYQHRLKIEISQFLCAGKHRVQHL